MKVRVLDGKIGFYGNALRRGADENKAKGDVFNIEVRYHSTQKDEKGKPVVITEEQQFSARWMEKVPSGPVAKKDK